GQFDELHIDVADSGEVVFDDLDLDGGSFLKTLQDVEAAASAIAFERVGGITIRPSRKPVSAMSAMRPSIMTLVSSILKLFLPDFSPPKTPPSAARLSRSPLFAPTANPT